VKPEEEIQPTPQSVNQKERRGEGRGGETNGLRSR
jgi:hypothetical protein